MQYVSVFFLRDRPTGYLYNIRVLIMLSDSSLYACDKNNRNLSVTVGYRLTTVRPSTRTLGYEWDWAEKFLVIEVSLEVAVLPQP